MNLKPPFLIKRGYYILPSPSTALVTSTFVTRRVSSQIKVISIGKNYNGFFWQVQNQVVQRSSFNHCHSSRLFFFRNLLKFINGKRNTCYKASLMLVSVGLGNFNFRGRKINCILAQMSTPSMINFLCVNRYDAASLKMPKYGLYEQFTIPKKDLSRYFWNWFFENHIWLGNNFLIDSCLVLQ